MLRCFTSRSLQSSSLNSSENHRAISQENFTAITLRSNALSSPAVDFTGELAVDTPSYNEIWSKIHVIKDEEWESKDLNYQEQCLTQILQPNHEDIEESLQQSSSNPFTQHLSDYFDHTEQICRSLLILNKAIHHTRSHYLPIDKLIDVLPHDSDSLSQAQCNWAYDILLKFENTENPFPTRGTPNFSDMHRCFSDLKEQVDGCRHKPQSRERITRCATTGSSSCHIGTVVGFAITAVSITAHALIALLARSFYPPGLSKSMQKDLAHIVLLDAAARSAFVLHNDLQTIGGLVRSLETAVEGDKSHTRIGIACGRERYPVSMVINYLAKTHHNINLQLTELEEHICRCLAAINRERAFLLKDMQLMSLQESAATPTSQSS